MGAGQPVIPPRQSPGRPHRGRATCVLALTVGHELDDEPRVGDVGAAHLRAAHALTHLRHHARHLVWGKGTTHLGQALAWELGSLKRGLGILMEMRWEAWWDDQVPKS